MKRVAIVVSLLFLIILAGGFVIWFYLQNESLSDIQIPEGSTDNFVDNIAYTTSSGAGVDREYIIYYFKDGESIDVGFPKDEVPFLGNITEDGVLPISTIDFDFDFTAFNSSSSLNYNYFEFNPVNDEQIVAVDPPNPDRSTKDTSGSFFGPISGINNLYMYTEELPNSENPEKEVSTLYMRDGDDDVRLFQYTIDFPSEDSAQVEASIRDIISPIIDKSGFLLSFRSDCGELDDEERCIEVDDVDKTMVLKWDENSKLFEESVSVDKSYSNIEWRNPSEFYTVSEGALYLVDIDTLEERELNLEFEGENLELIGRYSPNLVRDTVAFLDNSRRKVYIYDARKDEVSMLVEFENPKYVVGWQSKEELLLVDVEESENEEGEKSYQNKALEVFNVKTLERVDLFRTDFVIWTTNTESIL